jgi:type III secretory pathway component EscV
MDMKNPQKVKLFHELLKIIILVNNKQPIEEMNQTECHISDSKEYNYAHYLLKKMENQYPTLSFEEQQYIAMKQVADILLKKIQNKNYDIEI